VSTVKRKEWIECNNELLSIEKQCELLGLSRSSYYYQPCGESSENLALMNAIDKLYTKYPFYGARRLRVNLPVEFHSVNIKKVRRLMKLMGIEAIYPKPNLSIPDLQHKIYPYLLRGIKIERINQVWSTDITYVPMEQGFLYLCAVVDWYSRYILSWEISNTLTTDFCLKAVNDALKSGQKPEIFNTDQGSQFTANDFTKVFIDQEILVSMDGKGRALDNIFIERFWRTIKYEHIYLKEYKDGKSLFEGLLEYIQFYNYERKHQSLLYLTPNQVFNEQLPVSKNSANLTQV
jgi:putative transposase